MDDININDVRKFWEKNPLFTGETEFEKGNQSFFNEHREVIISDCFAGSLDRKLLPQLKHGKVLDLGCGPGFWSLEIQRHCAPIKMYSADLTFNALTLTQKRLSFGTYQSTCIQANAEELPFKNSTFDYINCQGVIHHTPDTDKCLKEIARIIKPKGKALISVYYKNTILRNWSKIQFFGKILFKLGAKLKGRGRENLFYQNEPEEIVRIYDGLDNPIGKAYTNNEFKNILGRDFEIKRVFYHFFPARAFPFKLPNLIHRFLDRKLPFMIYAEIMKKEKLVFVEKSIKN